MSLGRRNIWSLARSKILFLEVQLFKVQTYPKRLRCQGSICLIAPLGHYIHQIAWSIRFVEVKRLLYLLNKTLINKRWLLFRRLSIDENRITELHAKKPSVKVTRLFSDGGYFYPRCHRYCRYVSNHYFLSNDYILSIHINIKLI